MKPVSCEHLIDYFNRSLTDEEMTLFEKHIDECGDCKEAVQELEELHDSLPFLAEPQEPPAGMKDRILSNVFEEEPMADLVQPEATPIHSVKKKKPWAYILAAALFLSLIGNGWALMTINDQIAEKAETDQIQSVTLLPTNNFAGHGEASMVIQDNTMNLYVQAEDLTSTENNEVYQVWLIDGDKPIPAGSFIPNQNLQGGSFFTIKQTSNKWDSVAITLEPQPGNSLPEGEVVLSSSL